MKKLLAITLAFFAGAVFAESRLDTVMQKKVLAVCTTGDYKPYTFVNSDGTFEGIDIAMAKSLAKSLGAEVKWVKTTWKTLTPDFLTGECDIAMGGISVILERQKIAFFSNTLDIDGKIPLVRCENKDKYQTIEQINQPHVTLIEPKGGTNEAFVHKYLPKANLTLSDDNMAIFQQLVDKKYEVMITDSSEALYQQKRHPELCAINPTTPMQYGEKAYMLPKGDIIWKQYVDQWLHLAKATGEYQAVIDQWLASH
ncbi:transporter substrate-binding domain-containing protein [Entomomonas asaccharolytica]|uniref:Transporter substrate-binding domain-containing protein n=1 Tax=Entomomonas asaccharolytica TaxID=2785331 RepID=A0A974NFD0_9GAMM|nr:transporter substrate-binding domain-containing protein [Entomomonas asaccharolytica]QQP85606.1 transporter substrate-binding domain-containing protein [Entomomonas asaccharolytica]